MQKLTIESLGSGEIISRFKNIIEAASDIISDYSYEEKKFKAILEISFNPKNFGDEYEISINHKIIRPRKKELTTTVGIITENKSGIRKKIFVPHYEKLQIDAFDENKQNNEETKIRMVQKIVQR